MSNNSNVTAGKPKVGGAMSVAPIGTALPTDATTALAAAFVSLGYISEDGLVNAESTETTPIKAWGGETVMVLPGEHTDTYQCTLLEVLSADVQKFIRGSDNVTDASGALSITANGNGMEEHVIVVDMLLRGWAARHVIPRGIITERGDIAYVDNAAAGFEITITALADADGNTHYEFIAAAAESAAPAPGSAAAAAASAAAAAESAAAAAASAEAAQAAAAQAQGS